MKTNLSAARCPRFTRAVGGRGWRRTGLLAAAAVASASLAACGGGSAATSSAAPATLTIGDQFAAVNFNPWLSPNGANGSLDYTGAVYDSLTRLTGASKVIPGLATNWTWKTPTLLQLTLRSGVKFSDGTPVNAAAVAANFAYAKTAQPAAQLNQFVTGLKTTVISPTTIQFALPAPNPDLLIDFATGAGFIVSPNALKDPARLATTPQGSGAYILAPGSIPNQQYTFTRNTRYWDPSAFHYSKIVLKVYSTAQAADDAIRSGQINMAAGIPSDLQADEAAGLTVNYGPPNSMQGLWLNDRAGKLLKPLGNLMVRQALNYALDRPAIDKAAFGSLVVPESLVVGPGSVGYAASENYAYDPGRARQLLAQAGYPHGFTLKVLSTSGSQDLMAQAIAGDLQKIGVTVKISDYNTNFVQQAFSGTWPAMVFEWEMAPEVSALANILSPAGLGNINHSADPQIDGYLSKAMTTTGPAQAAAVTSLVSAVNTQAWFLTVGQLKFDILTSHNIQCAVNAVAGCLLYSIAPK